MKQNRHPSQQIYSVCAFYTEIDEEKEALNHDKKFLIKNLSTVAVLLENREEFTGETRRMSF